MPTPTYVERIAGADDSELIRRVKGCLLDICADVFAETGVSDHAARVAFAQRVLNSFDSYARQIAGIINCHGWGAGGTTFYSASVPDATLKTVMQSIWSWYATAGI